MKIGLIGFGSIGQRHYDNLQKYTKNIVVLSKRKDLKSVSVANDWNGFVKQGPYEVIFVTNETFKHLPTIAKCVKLKPRAIFVEKPLSHNTKGLKRLAGILKNKKISLYVGYNFQFLKPLIEIKKILQNNKLGKIYYLRLSVGQDLRVWRSRDYRLNYAAKKSWGGGVMLDLIHEINYAGWLLGEALIPKTAVIKKVSVLKINTEDCADSIFITRGGTIVSVHQDYLRPTLKRNLDIVGEKASLAWDYGDSILVIQYQDKTIKKKIIIERNLMFTEELKYFFNALKQKKYFTNLEEAIRDISNIEYLKKYAKN